MCSNPTTHSAAKHDVLIISVPGPLFKKTCLHAHGETHALSLVMSASGSYSQDTFVVYVPAGQAPDIRHYTGEVSRAGVNEWLTSLGVNMGRTYAERTRRKDEL